MKNINAMLTAGLLLVLLATVSGCANEPHSPVTDHNEPVDREYALLGLIHGYYGIGGDIDGVKNPVLTARVGETVRIILINGERMPHDIALREHDVRSREILTKDEQTTLVFTAREDDTYYCTIPGHVQIGMSGKFEIIPQPASSPIGE